MAEIMLIRDEAEPWQEVPDFWKAKQKDGDPGLRFKVLIPQGAASCNMQRTQYYPGHHEAPHKHPEDEILYILEGQIQFGRDVLGAGDAIFVPRDKVYSLHTGDAGCTFVRVGLSNHQSSMSEEDLAAFHAAGG
jgi:quercetin dioxygenase-like cupin family protein